jgi:hypothetical protein
MKQATVKAMPQTEQVTDRAMPRKMPVTEITTMRPTAMIAVKTKTIRVTAGQTVVETMRIGTTVDLTVVETVTDRANKVDK